MMCASCITVEAVFHIPRYVMVFLALYSIAVCCTANYITHAASGQGISRVELHLPYLSTL